MSPHLQATAERGERTYRERYQTEYEKSRLGMYVVIDVDGEQTFIADTPEGALREAMRALPEGTFHLIKIGAPAVFRVGYSRCGMHSGDSASGGS